MPRMGGHEFLQELRHDPSLHHTTVFVMTASTAEKDRALAYKSSVAGYIVKDGPGQNLVEAISMLGLYCQMVAAA
jgi:CheY-like chemotaxis protein